MNDHRPHWVLLSEVWSAPDHYSGSDIKVPSSYRDAISLTLRSSGPRTSLLLIAVGACMRVHLGYWSWKDLWPVLLLLLGWSVVEWCVHYYLLHGNRLPMLGMRAPLLLRRMHERHHLDPWDFSTLHFKGATVLGAWSLVTGAMYVLVGLGPALSFSTVLLCLVEVYQWVHLLVHSKVPVSSSLMRGLMHTHIMHHVSDGTRWMGVTTALADRLMGTAEASPNDVGPSPNGAMPSNY